MWKKSVQQGEFPEEGADVMISGSCTAALLEEKYKPIRFTSGKERINDPTFRKQSILGL